MKRKILYSDIRPLSVKKDQQIISDCFREELKKSDQLIIAVGFSSYLSLQELDRLVDKHNIKNVCVILGMYFFIGFPESLHELALKISEKWKRAGIGEIRVSHSFRYHGKIYCFLKNNQIFSVILGSQNLSFLVPEEKKRIKQYEIALLTKDSEILKDFLEHINELKSEEISENIETFETQELFDEKNISLKKKKIFKIRLTRRN